MEHLLTIEDLSLEINNKKLLNKLNFTLSQADYLCILGANGAGKSSVLKMLMGIIKPTSGSITLNQQSIDKLSQKQRALSLSYVPQSHTISLSFSVEEFVKMGRYAHRTALSEWQTTDRHAFERAISITNTEAFINRQMNTLSGGEAQRVMIAAALCQQTEILLLDEPTSFLDPYHQVAMHQLIADLNQQHNIAIIEVSHDLNHAVQHSQHILALKQGQNLWYGNSADLLQSEQLHQLYDQQFVFTTHPQTGAIIALTSESK